MENTLCNINKKGHFILKTFLIALIFSAIIFIPYMIYDGGYFLYYGDFNVQEIPFYQMIHDAILSGSGQWSSTTDLGSGLVGSYSFYLLGSPFFWITMLFPSKAVPYLIGPLFMLKFACAAVSAYVYLKRYVKNNNSAVIGALIYAFSGFSIYNIFFFHFHEAIIAFPLLLAALDSFMKDKRRGVLALAVFTSCILNYYFFAGQVVFVIIYWMVMVCTKNYKVKLTQMLLLVFEVILGFVATAILLLPSILAVMNNPRLESYPNGWEALAYSKPQKYWYIILSFFFPSDMPAFPNFTKDVDANWASVSGWLPLFSMAGVIAFMQTKKRDWLKKVITILIIMALIPVLNSAFQLFNSSIYYARWFYMFDLMLSLATIRAIENKEANWERAIGFTTCITVGIAVLIGFIPMFTSSKGDETSTFYKLGVEAYPDRYWVYVAMALAGLLLFTLIIKKFKSQARKFAIYTFIGIGLISTISTSYILCTGKTYANDDQDFIIPYALNNGEDLTLDDLDNVRSDFYNSLDNMGMYWQIPTINAFHSVVSSSIMTFYKSIGITRDVASRPDTNLFALRSFLSCKYLFDCAEDDDDFQDDLGNTEMPGWAYLDDENGFHVFENNFYVPMGFMYDSFISESDFEKLHDYDKCLALMKVMVLSDEQIKKYSDITGYGTDYDASATIKAFNYSNDAYFYDCKRRAATACSSFEYTNEGFNAEITNTGDSNLLFFSVPYDSGWTAYVNDSEVEIENVDNGFMAIKVAGNSTISIRFVYKQPGFALGIIITTMCGIIYVIYFLLIVAFNVIKKRKKAKNALTAQHFSENEIQQAFVDVSNDDNKKDN